ncbi:TIGR02530 family flagellar biosynthesis protein [Clostridium tetanomorphum]|uniref:Flagellar biosynthesis protein n=1 Tax=Clostridium tetanomorphum TaxID=1553 RepID=A0A923E7U6_CLOTT|nr:TIGR02530 family flagellar biosynthesis protein [Clostridium tetanomorphum]MBC2396679.1 flagellar biosynthesis protein [Clostridium tetanomorphum]NRZ98306.1 flagellar operon protein [Clostridium tetanomorphum]
MGYRVINGKIQFFEDLHSHYNLNNNKVNKSRDTSDFSNILKKEINKNESFVISNHALERLKERNITFDEIDMKKINTAINRAEEKGCKEGVILYKDIALITSMKNRTIITALNKNDSEGNIITNIDGLVIL